MSSPSALAAGQSPELAEALLKLRNETVRLGWDQVELMERIDPELSRRLQQDILRARVEDAHRTLRPLKPWPASPDRVLRVMTNQANQVRMRRVLDVVEPGDRVLDIGVNYGYLTGVLLRDGRLSAYTGLDLSEHLLEAVQQMREVNSLTDVPCKLAVQNLYDLTPEWVAETDPDLVVLLEVLEHVPNAEQALTTIGRCIRPDAAIVFSIPVLGRLEACWGHVSMFDAARVRRMIAGAGLMVQHVEVVHDTWQLVVVSPTNRVLPRVVALASRPPAALPEPPPSVPTFQVSRLSSATQSRTARGGAQAHMTQDRDGLHITVTAPGKRLPLRLGNHLRRIPTAVAGVALPVAGDRTVRLELASPDGPRIRSLTVQLRSPGSGQVSGWRWQCKPATQLTPSPRTHVLRPGLPSGPWMPIATGRFQAGGATAHVLIEVERGSSATLTIRRASAIRAGTPDQNLVRGDTEDV
jgi:2-polyprenyl-3-methyl-5-hydroxy-6-metoxy-1,4-benzoquinol methylase